jgi:hypothetical protein
MEQKKFCNGCKRNRGLIQFYNSNSPLFSDGKVPLCKTCIKEMMPEDDLEKVQSVLRKIDKPFLIDVWNNAKSSTNQTVGDYFRQINSLHQYRNLTYDDSIFYDKDNSIVEKEISKASESIEEVETEHGKIAVTKELKSKWGNYPNRDILEMEKLYVEMERANDISTPQHKRQLFFYCKLNVLMDKALEEGDFGGYEKLSRQFDNLTKSSGFRPIDKKDTNMGIRTFSQIYEEVEKDGYIEPYPITERQDIVDRTIQYILNYQLKLLNAEQLSSPPPDTPKLLDSERIVDDDE